MQPSSSEAITPAARFILGVRVDATTYADACAQIIRWAIARESRYICAANVHLVMEAFDHDDYREIINHADLVTADGVPLTWALRLMGVRGAPRVYGPDLTRFVCAKAAEANVPVAFIGSTEEVLAALRHQLAQQFPSLSIVLSYSPPFRRMTEDEQNDLLAALRESGAAIVFVGLGCPKQERWMAQCKGRFHGPMLGVGAAFDFIAQRKSEAPDWLQHMGLEWLFRLSTEPRRLWRRYVFLNPRFVLLLLRQLIYPADSRRLGRSRHK